MSWNMRREELEYELPAELIAQRPAEPRDASRLLVLDRAAGRVADRAFRDIGEYLRPGDVLVRNDTRVVPARFFCRRQSGGRIEALFLHESEQGWRVLLKPSARLRVGEVLTCDASAYGMRLCEKGERGAWLVRPEPPIAPLELLGYVGQTPLPPYIHREAQPDAEDERRYQTVYARRDGAVAAPTAGLHFTPELLDRLAAAGIECCDVTLHVGIGTFAPITADELADHEMHAEWYDADRATVARLHAARREGRRIVAVGTTSVRVLESLALTLGVPDATPSEHSGWTDIFIYPPHVFRNVDVLLTNFHLPGSTLIALLMALAGVEPVRAAYAHAVRERYRFFSYGDAMLVT